MVEFLSDGTLYWNYGSETGSFQDIGAPEDIAYGEFFVADFSGITGTPPNQYDGVKLVNTNSYPYVHGGAGARIASVTSGIFHSSTSGNFGPHRFPIEGSNFHIVNSFGNSDKGRSIQGYIDFRSYVPNVSGDIVPKFCWGPAYTDAPSPGIPIRGSLAIRFVYI